jgi:hypothetical protein
MSPRARILNKKIEIIGLLPFTLTLPKNSPRVVKITKTAVFIVSPLAPDLIVPVPISQ